MTYSFKSAGIVAVTALVILAGGPSARSEQRAGMPEGVMPGGPMAAMERMSREMAAVPMTGDADRDFAGMMIPHHQGAVDMARYEMAHGRDRAMLRLARKVVAAQEKEIAEMKAWQAGQAGQR